MSRQQTVTIEQQIAELQSQQDEGTRRIAGHTKELSELLARRVTLDEQRTPLVQAHTAAVAKMTEDQQNLARNKGKANQGLYESRLRSSENAVATAQNELTMFDTMNNPTGIEARIVTLRASIQTEESAKFTAEKTVSTLIEQRNADLEKVGAQAYKRLLLAFSDYLDVMESDGQAVSDWLQNTNPVSWTQFLADLSMDAYEVGSLLTGQRRLLEQKREAIRERLKQL